MYCSSFGLSHTYMEERERDACGAHTHNMKKKGGSSEWTFGIVEPNIGSERRYGGIVWMGHGSVRIFVRDVLESSDQTLFLNFIQYPFTGFEKQQSTYLFCPVFEEWVLRRVMIMTIILLDLAS